MSEEEIKRNHALWRAQDTETRLPTALLDALPAVVVRYMIDHELLTVEEQLAIRQWQAWQQR